MSLVTNLPGADTFVLQAAITAYADEAYTNAKKLSGTGIVGDNPMINTDTETFIGQMRWFKPLNPVINIASLTDATPGTGTVFASDYSTYVKSVRTHGATQVNLRQVVSKEDGLAKIGRDFSETRAQDEHNGILAVIKGVAIAEALNGAATGSGATGLGGQSFTNDPADKKYGFYVDLGAALPVVAASASIQGAARAEGFLNAMGMAWKDYEPDYAYLVCSPETMASLRSANLVDQDGVVEANVKFNTIFNGKLRLIQTRASQSFSSAQLTKINTGDGVNITGTKTSFIILPGAIAMKNLDVPTPTEIDRDAKAYKGGGSTDIWHRWGYVLAPAGYDWLGSQTVFAEDASYQYSVTGGTPEVLTAATVGVTTTGTWGRKTSSALSLGILPVFHS